MPATPGKLDAIIQARKQVELALLNGRQWLTSNELFSTFCR
jgi:hypothetical protein